MARGKVEGLQHSGTILQHVVINPEDVKDSPLRGEGRVARGDEKAASSTTGKHDHQVDPRDRAGRRGGQGARKEEKIRRRKIANS